VRRYVLEAVPWHKTQSDAATRRGAFSNWTGVEFGARFSSQFHEDVSFLAAASFASLAVLANAIELANSTETAAVAHALRATALDEFFADVAFNADGQANASMLLTQFGPASNAVWSQRAQVFAGGGCETSTCTDRIDSVRVVHEPTEGAAQTLFFPMPTWAQRECMWTTSANAWPGNFDAAQACSAHGACNDEGVCVCENGWEGSTCASAISPPTDWERFRDGVLNQLAWLIALLMLCLCGLGGAFLMWRKRRELGEALKIEKQPLLREVGTNLQPSIELRANHRYMLFLSHVWSTGQDQVAVIKRRLQSLLPNARIFLDVEDLENIDQLEVPNDQRTSPPLVPPPRSPALLPDDGAGRSTSRRARSCSSSSHAATSSRAIACARCAKPSD
jgi:hypothetical protein